MSAADINLNGLKGSLALESRWVAFREEPVPGRDRKSKVPYTPSGFPAAIDNRENWATREEAERGAQGLSVDDRKTGIGIVLGMWKTPVGGIDLDTCINEEGELEPWAATIVNALPGYWEISINGEGLHALFRFKREDALRLRAALKQYGTSHTRPSEKPHKPGISTYLGSRYLTVSENLWPGSSETIREVPTEDLLRVIEQLAPAVAPPRLTAKPKDETRSGWGYRLAIKTVAFGMGKRAFLNALYDDEDGAAWAEEDFPRNENRAWENALAKYGWCGQWKRRGKQGQPLSNLHNALLSLRNAEELRDLFAWDEMLRAEMLLKPLNPREAWEGPRPVRDTDVNAVQEWLQGNWLVTMGKDTAFQAVETVARERAYHPVRDYLRRLEWDGTERLDSWLATYFGAPQGEYTAAIGRMFLIAMVARIFEPGCQADYMLILEGEQGQRKSSALAILAGQWFSDNLPPVRNSADHDVSMHLRGKWLIEIGEMSAMDKADAAALKSFVTRRVEQYRPSYGRKEAYEPRQCLFVGTTNEEVYLRDATGGRRFWPVLTGEIDMDRLRADRDQLLAEAVARFRRGEQWWPDRDFEKTTMQPEQEARYEADAWEDVLRAFLADETRTSVPEIATRALGLKNAQLGTRDTRRITAILRRFGFTQEKDREGKRFWVRAGDPFGL